LGQVAQPLAHIGRAPPSLQIQHVECDRVLRNTNTQSNHKCIKCWQQWGSAGIKAHKLLRNLW
jgi:hypothetical protein